MNCQIFGQEIADGDSLCNETGWNLKLINSWMHYLDKSFAEYEFRIVVHRFGGRPTGVISFRELSPIDL